MTEKDKDSPFFIPLITMYLKTTTLRFAVVDEDISFNGYGYESLPIQIGAVKSTVDSQTDNVELTLSDVTDAFKSAVLNYYDFRGSRIEIIEIAWPSDGSFRDIIAGEMDNIVVDDGKSIFKATVKSGILQVQTGRTTMLSCNASFGDPEDCCITKTVVTGVIQSDSTQTKIILDTVKPDGFWRYGILTIGSQSVIVDDNVGATITVHFPFYKIPIGNYRIENGCCKTFDFCGKQYGNKRNFSGFPGIPDELVIK